MCWKRPVIVSACLLGFSCRYDGGSKPLDPEVAERLKKEYLPIPVCPEQLGGLPTPRLKMEITSGDGGDVLRGVSKITNEKREDISQTMIKGARQVACYAMEYGITMAILKDGSPSCGVYTIRRRGSVVEGMGVTAALLKDQGVELLSEEDL